MTKIYRENNRKESAEGEENKYREDSRKTRRGKERGER